MGKKVILVAVYNRTFGDMDLVECRSLLLKKGVKILHVSRFRHFIETENCMIRFIMANRIEHACGVSGDICFNFTDSERYYIRCPMDGSKYNGTFIDYVYEIERGRVTFPKPQ